MLAGKASSLMSSRLPSLARSVPAKVFPLTPSITSTLGCPSSVAAISTRFCLVFSVVLPISTHSSPASGCDVSNSLFSTLTPSLSTSSTSTQ